MAEEIEYWVVLISTGMYEDIRDRSWLFKTEAQAHSFAEKVRSAIKARNCGPREHINDGPRGVSDFMGLKIDYCTGVETEVFLHCVSLEPEDAVYDDDFFGGKK